MWVVILLNAGGGTRTPTLFLEVDFESTASTNSATSARCPDLIVDDLKPDGIIARPLSTSTP